jgi:MFS family permease
VTRREPNTALRLLAAGLGLSVLGDFVAVFALTLRLHDTGGSGLSVAALMLAGTLPLVVLSPWTGLLVDRVENARLIESVALVQCGIAVALAFTPSRLGILLLMTAMACGTAVVSPALAALTPVVARGEVMRANALTETAFSLGAMLGPVLGGLLSGTVGTRGALLLDAGTFLVVAAATALTRATRRPMPGEAGAPKPRARDGLVAIRRDPLLLVMTATMVPSLVVVAGSNVAEVFFVKDVLHASDTAFGIVAGSWMLGMVAGARLLGRREATGDRALTSLFMACVVGVGVLLALAALSPTIWLVPVAFLGGGVLNGASNVARRTLLHRRVSEALRGRAFAAYGGMTNTALLVAYVGGGVAVNTVGPRTTLLAGGLASALIGVAGYLRVAAVDRGPGRAPS